MGYTGSSSFAAVSELWGLGGVAEAPPALIFWSLNGPLSCALCLTQYQSLGRAKEMLSGRGKRHQFGILLSRS